VLLVLEVLSFGIKHPEMVIYKNTSRTCHALLFRKEILYQFSSLLFQDISTIFQIKNPSAILEDTFLKITNGTYTKLQLSRGQPWLDAAIVVAGGDLGELNEVDYVHWKLYFAKMLIEFG